MDPKDEIKLKIDMVDLVGEYVQLKPGGSERFKGLCPFHGEKTPSFNVSRDRANWHCFGCGEGGDCFDFVMRMEGLSFPEALMHLGKKTGVEIARLPTKQTNLRARMMQINDLAQKFYRKVLLDSTSAISARAYMNTRNISEALAERFGMGYSPDKWDVLSSFLLKRGFSEAELVQAGVALKRKKGSGVIDRFRNRIMIPLRDHHGNAVGFTARSMPGDDNGPKYMNSPETPVYSKSHIVYGLDLAKKGARDSGFIVITEGNLDVVGSHKAGVTNVVASSGTALTEDQLALLKRYTQTIVFAFDADAAGFKAANKGIDLARGLELDVRAIILPDDVKDPDELVQKDPQQWIDLVKKSVPIMEFFIEYITRGKNLRSIDDKRLVSKELLPAISAMSSVVEREHWLQVVADLLGTPVDQLRKAIVVPTVESEKAAKPAKTTVKPPVISKNEKIIQLLFGYAITSEVVFKKMQDRLSAVLEGNQKWSDLYNLAKLAYDSGSQSAQKSFFSRIREQVTGQPNEDDLMRLLDTSTFLTDETFQDLSPQQVLKQIEHLYSLLERQSIKRNNELLARQLRQAEQSGDSQEVTRLLGQLQ
jgi:DNA primase